MTDQEHESITRIVSAQGGYGKGIDQNPFAASQTEWFRRHSTAGLRRKLTNKIWALYEPRFVTPPETAELIEALITMTDSRQILELGMHTGFTALHILRAIVGKPGAKLVSVDCRPAFDREFFADPEITAWFEPLEGWTPGCLSQLAGRMFDLVFVDSDHSPSHNEAERLALIPLTKPGSIWLFHDLPQWQSPADHEVTLARRWAENLVTTGFFRGAVFPTCEQDDRRRDWGAGYPKECNPHLGMFIRA